jgi:type II secretory pathway component PulK
MTAIIGNWLAIASLAAAAGTFVFLVWWQVRGVRGAALATVYLCIFIIASAFAGLHASQNLIPTALLAAIERAAWWPMIFALFVLADAYAADHNSHRALTTILYLRWERLRSRRG